MVVDCSVCFRDGGSDEQQRPCVHIHDGLNSQPKFQASWAPFYTNKTSITETLV